MLRKFAFDFSPKLGNTQSTDERGFLGNIDDASCSCHPNFDTSSSQGRSGRHPRQETSLFIADRVAAWNGSLARRPPSKS